MRDSNGGVEMGIEKRQEDQRVSYPGGSKGKKRIGASRGGRKLVPKGWRTGMRGKWKRANQKLRGK